MHLKIADICYIIFAAVMLFLLLRELVPDSVKSFWKYKRQQQRDHKAGYSRKWTFTFKA